MTSDNLELDNRLRDELGSVPGPNFEAWCQKHPDAVASLISIAAEGSMMCSTASVTRTRIMASLKWIAATLLVAGSVVWLTSGDRSISPGLFADEIPAIDNVQEMTWTVTYYTRFTSKDGKQTWIEKERRLHAYRHPGHYRETMQNARGEVWSVLITDQNAGRTLALQMNDKKAVLKGVEHPQDARGPFAWAGDELRQKDVSTSTRVKSVSLQEAKKIDGALANVVRIVLQDVELGKTFEHDLYFDKTSKRLSGIWAANDAALTRDVVEQEVKEPGQKWSRMEPIASFTHEINLSPKLNVSDFSLDAPEGFALETIAKPTVTEDEMLSYLRAAIQFSGGQFPDAPTNAYDRDKLNAEWEKAEAARSAESTALIAQIEKIRLREIYQSPISKFLDDHAVPESFHYVGSGIKLGEKDQLVGWYKLKASQTLRAIYGDLTIRDINESDLPFATDK